MGGRCAADDDEKARERTGECEHSVFGGATTKRSSSSEGGREIGREERKKASKISISLPPSLPPFPRSPDPTSVFRLLPLKIHLPNGRPGDGDV